MFGIHAPCCIFGCAFDAGHNARVTAPMHRIFITRPAGRYRDAMRRYRIEVDGSEVGTIGAGEELAVPAVAGAHVVQARIDWAGSPKITVAVSDDHLPRLVVRPAGNAAMALVQLVGRTRYLKLEPS
jgi:hypothetical protein